VVKISYGKNAWSCPPSTAPINLVWLGLLTNSYSVQFAVVLRLIGTRSASCSLSSMKSNTICHIFSSHLPYLILPPVLSPYFYFASPIPKLSSTILSRICYRGQFAFNFLKYCQGTRWLWMRQSLQASYRSTQTATGAWRMLQLYVTWFTGKRAIFTSVPWSWTQTTIISVLVLGIADQHGQVPSSTALQAELLLVGQNCVSKCQVQSILAE